MDRTSTPKDYAAKLEVASFTGFTTEDQPGVLLEIVRHMCRKLLGVELAVALVKLDS